MGRPAISGGRRISGVENTARVEYATTASVAAARSWRVTPAWMSPPRPGHLANGTARTLIESRVAERKITERIVERTARLYDLRVRGGPVPAGVPMVIAASRGVRPGACTP